MKTLLPLRLSLILAKLCYHVYLSCVFDGFNFPPDFKEPRNLQETLGGNSSCRFNSLPRTMKFWTPSASNKKNDCHFPNIQKHLL